MAELQTIDDLKALVSNKGGIAKGNVFAVALPPLAGLRSRELNLLCSNVNLPGRQIMSQEREIGLIRQKVANNHAYDDVSLTFRVLNDYGIKEYFETWQNLCINQQSLEVGYLNEYAFNMKIHQLKRATHADQAFIGQNDTIYSCELIQAFPTTMNAIELGDGNTDAGVNLSVQISYKNWKSSVSAGTLFGVTPNESSSIAAAAIGPQSQGTGPPGLFSATEVAARGEGGPQ